MDTCHVVPNCSQWDPNSKFYFELLLTSLAHFDCYPKIGKTNFLKVFGASARRECLYGFFLKLEMKRNSKEFVFSSFQVKKTTLPLWGPKNVTMF